MSDLSHCTAPNDYTPYHGGFRGHFRVNNATNSTYSNLYLNPPANTEWGIATLTSEPQRTWSMDGGIRWLCDRSAYLTQISPTNNTIRSGVKIVIDASGTAPVNVITGWFGDLQFNVTWAFYVEALNVPLSFSTEKPGSYFACTDQKGDIGVYFRRSNTTAYDGCEDISLDILEG